MRKSDHFSGKGSVNSTEASKSGIITVHSTADRDLKHVRLADESVCIGQALVGD